MAEPTARTAATATQLLRQIDDWMGSMQHGADHPWRAAIAETLAAPAPVGPAVDGWDIEFRADPRLAPPVIVNPNATPASLADWARGQIEQASYIAEALKLGAGGTHQQQAIGALLHFQLQTVPVLRVLSDRLFQDEVQRG